MSFLGKLIKTEPATKPNAVRAFSVDPLFTKGSLYPTRRPCQPFLFPSSPSYVRKVRNGKKRRSRAFGGVRSQDALPLRCCEAFCRSWGRPACFLSPRVLPSALSKAVRELWFPRPGQGKQATCHLECRKAPGSLHGMQRIGNLRRY